MITPDLIRELGLDTRGLSLISASFFYAFALMQIPIGMYLDAIGPRIAMTALSLLGAAGALVFACGDSTGALVAGRILLGAGMACNLMGTLKLITLWFPPLRFATLAALVLSFGTLGNMTAATPLVLMVQALGWRMSFVVFSGINILLALLFFAVVRDRPRHPGGRRTPPGRLDRPAGSPDKPPRPAGGKGLLDHLPGGLLPVRHIRRGASPVGRPLSDDGDRDLPGGRPATCFS